MSQRPQYSYLSARSGVPPVLFTRDSPDPDPNTTRRSEEPEDIFIKGCRQKVRWINVGIDIQDIIRFGIRSDTGILGADDDDDEFHNFSVEQRGLLETAYRAILTLTLVQEYTLGLGIPKLKKKLLYQADANARYFYNVVEAMQDGCNASRGDVDPSNTEALTPRLSEDAPLSPSGNVNVNATLSSPSTPPSRPNIMIDPRRHPGPGQLNAHPAIPPGPSDT